MARVNFVPFPGFGAILEVECDSAGQEASVNMWSSEVRNISFSWQELVKLILSRDS